MEETVQLTYNFQAFLDTLGLVQGLTLGILLISLNKRKYRSTFFLGLFLVFFSLKLIPFISISLNAGEIYPALFLLPLNFSWLLFPLFFTYTKQVTVHSNNKVRFWVLYPGIIAFLLQTIIYFLPYDTKLDISQSFWYPLLFTFAGIIYAWAIGLLNLRLLYHHRVEVNNSFSLVARKEMQWARIFLIYSLSTSVITHIMFFITPDNYYFKVLFSMCDLIAIYWVSYHGVVQRNVRSVLSKDWAPKFSEDESSYKMDTSRNATEELEDLMERIDQYMITSESFIHTELTIIDLAEELKVHPKRISTAINTICKQNFNSYVNQFRIKKAAFLIKNQEETHLSVAGIASEVGFHSKSAFYSAFKKELGTTPAQYKKNVIPL